MSGIRSGQRRGRLPRLALTLLILALATVALPAAAAARGVYVTDESANSVTLIDARTDQPLGGPIAVGVRPEAIAITPDGNFAYVANFGDESVSVIDTRSNMVGPPIDVAGKPVGLAISPDGRFAYVVSQEPDRLSVIDTATNALDEMPLQLAGKPAGVAITPDGDFAYVTCQESSQVLVIDTQTRRPVGGPIEVGSAPTDLAFTPDGRLAFVIDSDGSSVSVIETKSGSLWPTIPVLSEPQAIAISPDSQIAYVTNRTAASVTRLSTETGLALGGPIDLGGSSVSGIAITPDGDRIYVAETGSQFVRAVDTRTDVVTPIEVGSDPRGIAIVPDQPPHATFSIPGGRPDVPLGFDASASSDPDGSIGRFQWSFGDGTRLENGGATPAHIYRHPGFYKATLTLTDDEGCSTSLVFTGRTASCNGSPVATQTQAVEVSYPGVRVRCPPSAGRGGCRYRLLAVTRRHDGKAESTVTRVRLRASSELVVSLRPRRAFAGGFPVGHRVLVREWFSLDGSRRTRYARLRIVR